MPSSIGIPIALMASRTEMKQASIAGDRASFSVPHKTQNPVIKWTNAFPATTGSWNLVAYVENPNQTAGSSYAPYTFAVFDGAGKQVYAMSGVTIIPVGKNFAMFQGPVSFSATGTLRTTFSFDDSSIVWQKETRDADLAIKADEIRLTQDVPTPVVDAAIENTSLNDVKNVEAVGIVYDDNGNPVGVSRTLVNDLPEQGSQDITFTWENPFPADYASCDVPNDVSLVIDRSGSMASDSSNPPEPLTSVKNAALDFISDMGNGTKISLVSFATTPSNPIDQPLTTSVSGVTNAVNTISIHTDGLQYTDIADALADAGASFSADPASSTDKKVIILLTDGIPNKPTDTEVATLDANNEALALRSAGIEIYTIGLGKDVDDQFLTGIASDTGHYFKAPTKEDLDSIYTHIATALCTKHPVIEITTRIFGGI